MEKIKKYSSTIWILIFSFLLIACGSKTECDKSQTNESVASILTKAAEQGDAKAQFEAGLMYFYGVGVPVDMEKAAYWFEKAKKQGFEDPGDMLLKAQFNQL